MGLSDCVWNLIQRCWHVDRHMRPAADTIVHELKQAHALFEMAEVQQAEDALIVEPTAYSVPPGASLLARLRASVEDAAALSGKKERKDSLMTISSRRSFTPPVLVHGKGSPSHALIAQTSAHAVFSRPSFDTEPERSPAVIPVRLHLRPEGSEHTLVARHGGDSTGTIKSESAGLVVPILPLLPSADTAPIPFSRSPDW